MRTDLGQKIVQHKDASEALRQIDSLAARLLISMQLPADADHKQELLRIAAHKIGHQATRPDTGSAVRRPFA